MSSFKSNFEILMDRTAMPTGFEHVVDNYVRAWDAANMSQYLGNSIFVVTLSLLIHLVLVIPCANALSQFKFFGHRVIEVLFILCLFVTGIYIIIPQYVLLFELNMLNSLWALSLVYAVGGIPFSTFLLAGYMRTISRSYVEAARIDGANNWKILFRIMVPMSKPGIITVSMLAVIGYWNELFLAMIVLQDSALHTLPVGVANLFEVQQRATDFGALYAALMVVLLPTVIIYLVGQKYLIGAFNMGGVKE
jgi:N-acetylglucosamine transport system permease protein